MSVKPYDTQQIAAELAATRLGHWTRKQGLDSDVARDVRALLAEVESLRAMERRAEELHNEPRRGTDSWERGRYDAADYILTGKTS